MQPYVFYLPLSRPLPGPPNTKVTIGSEMSTQHIVMRNMKLFVFFTTNSHPMLGPVYAGIDGNEALRMTVASPDVDGALFRNGHDSWVGFDKLKCEHVLGAYSQAS